MGSAQSFQESSNGNLSTSSAATEVRRRKVLRGLIAGKPLNQAAIDAGYSESSADVAARLIMPHIRGAFQEAMLDKLPLGKLAETVAAGLDAKETHFAQFEGKFTDQRDVIAWGERRRYSELAANLMGVGAPKEDAAGLTSKALLIEVVTEGPMTRVAIASESNMKVTSNE
jgi:hypothetical protein